MGRDIKSIIKSISEVIEVEKIYQFSYNFNSTAFQFLMIVLPDTYHTKVDEMKPFINMVLLIDTGINYTVIKNGDVVKALRDGNLFFHLIFISENLAYEGLKSKPLPLFELKKLIRWNLLAKKRYSVGWERIQQFLLGALFHFDNGHFELSSFNLHQVAELTYRLYEKSILVTDKPVHLIRDHQRFLKSINPFLAQVFPSETKMDLRILQLLDQSYTLSRYSKDFKVSENDMKVLFQRIQELVERAEIAFNHIFQSIDELSNKSH